MITPELLNGKNILIRCDLDVPIKDGRVENDFRLQAMLPTINLALKHAHSVRLIGHLGRPEGNNPEFSLTPVREWLEKALNQSISFIDSGFYTGDGRTGESRLSLLENLRFDSREESIDREFAQILAQGIDLYIYEAFASYRPSTSLSLLPKILPTYTGLQFDREVETLTRLLQNPEHPTLLLISGAKPDKLEYAEALKSKFDEVLIGGALADKQYLTPDGKDINEVGVALFKEKIATAKTILFNGPLGKYEDGVNDKATKEVLTATKNSSAFSILGGGDTLACIPALGFAYTDWGFVSTGGGAMLEFLKTGKHPITQIIT